VLVLFALALIVMTVTNVILEDVILLLTVVSILIYYVTVTINVK